MYCCVIVTKSRVHNLTTDHKAFILHTLLSSMASESGDGTRDQNVELAEEKHRRKMVGNSSFIFVTLTCVGWFMFAYDKPLNLM